MTNEQFETLLCSLLQGILPYVCSVFSTPETNVFLHATLNIDRINLIWEMILQKFPKNIHHGSANLIRSFIANENVHVENDAISNVLAGGFRVYHPSALKCFNDYLQVLDTFIDHGARLNPLPHVGNTHSFSKSFGTFLLPCSMRAWNPTKSPKQKILRRMWLCFMFGGILRNWSSAYDWSVPKWALTNRGSVLLN